MEFVGVEDSFGESGTPTQLMNKYGLSSEKIMEKSMEKFMEESTGKFRLGIRRRNQVPKPCGAAAPQTRNVSHAHRGRQDEIILNSVLGTRPILFFRLSIAEASLDQNH